MSEESNRALTDEAAETRDEMLQRAYWRTDMLAFVKRRHGRDRRARHEREKVYCPECGHRRAAEFGGHAADCAQMYFPARFVPKIKHSGEFLAGSFVMVDPGIDLEFTPVVRLLATDGPLGPGEDPAVDRRRRVPVLLVPTYTIVSAANDLALAVAAVQGHSKRATAKLIKILRYTFLRMRVLHYYLLTLTVWDDLELRTARELRELAYRIVEAVAQWLDMRVKPTRRWLTVG